METITAYELSQLDDEWRRIVDSIWYFKTQEVAEQVKRDAFQTIEKREIKIYNSAQDYFDDREKEIRETALSKLSMEEKKALKLI